MTKTFRHVFIIHHFDKEGRECANLLALILKLLDIQTMYGEDLGGERISEGVQRRIESASVVVVILTCEPSQWITQEITWAIAHHVPLLLVIKEGVTFEGGIAGDLEQIRFAPGDFANVLVRVVNQVQTLTKLGLDIPPTPPRPSLGDEVGMLIVRAREAARKGRWEEFLALSKEAYLRDPMAFEAALNIGVALARMNQLNAAERHFLRMLEDFADVEASLLAKVYYNLAGVEEIRDAERHDVKLLRKQVRYLEKSVALDPKHVLARASLILCRVALGEFNEANAVLMDSLKHGRGFRKALRKVVKTKGAEGHRLLNKLPDWLYPILFPTCDEEDAEDAEDEEEEEDEDKDAQEK